MSKKDYFNKDLNYFGPDGVEYAKNSNGRIIFSKISGSLELPYLVEVQINSFKWFLEKGIDEAFKDSFPIESYSKNMSIEYKSCRFEKPVYDPLECKARDITYCSKVYATMGLKSNTEAGEIKESEIYVGELPIMTESGTFVVNGVEKAIVSQIVRSPGAYFSDTAEKSGVHIYNAEIIPDHGAWLQFESDTKEDKNKCLYVRIDRQKKMPAVILFKALGIDSDKELKRLFGGSAAFENTLRKAADAKKNDREGALMQEANWALADIFKKLKPGEPVTKEGAITFLVQKFFDDKRYRLGVAGRFKYAQKLGIYDRLVGRVLAEDLVTEGGTFENKATGEAVIIKGGVRFKKGTKLTKADVKALRDEEFFEYGAHTETIKVNNDIDQFSTVNTVKVYAGDKEGTEKDVRLIVGNDLNLTKKRITASDMIAFFSYFCNLQDGIGQADDIDHLGNRRIRCVGELLANQFGEGLVKMSKNVQQKMTTFSDMNTVTLKSLINIRPLTSSVREFFASSQLASYMDQVNPLAELANKRRISALGKGGISRDRASMEVRDVHYTHYGRICPIESPEGQNIGLINNFCTYAKINQYGFIQTPYRIVIHTVDANGKKHAYLSEKAVYLSADDEKDYYIAEANLRLGKPVSLKSVDKNADHDELVKEIIDEELVVRHDEDNIVTARENVAYVDVSPKQIVSIAAACIPFLAHDDATRALMGANMQRQALPLLRPSAPYVGTGMETAIAKDSGLAVVACADGEVTYMDALTIKIKSGKETREYKLQKFDRSNQDTYINQTPIVHVGDKVKAGQIIADGPAMSGGELALGQNVLIAYMTWNGYNYEDAIIMSERMVKDDVYTSIHIEKYEVQCHETKLGTEEITRDIPNVSEDDRAFLDEDGIIIQGAAVKEGDILVGKVTPKGQTEPTPEEKLLMAIFNEKAKDGKDTSLRVPHGGAGIVHAVRVFSKANKDPVPVGVTKIVRVYIVQKRKISEGDKMSGRHGNKGVISKILPVEDMPFLADGTPIDILLSPMGVPSRMNIGQIFEVHLGLACSKLGMRVATPAFDGVSNEELFAIMKKAGISEDGKTFVYDGRTGERFAERISVGVQYMIKLIHMVNDKLHARAVGPYSLVTQQPLGGKAQNGGQRFGEMEVWALEAYGAAHVLQEMLTIKSDDRVGRRKAYESIIKQTEIPTPGMPEAFKVFTKELKGLAVDVKLLDKNGKTIDMDELARRSLVEERKVNSSIRKETTVREESVDDVNPLGEEEVLAEEGLSITRSIGGSDNE